MYLLLFSAFWIILVVILFTQVFIPMFSNLKFFWIFDYWSVKRKYRGVLTDLERKEMEKEIQQTIREKQYE